MTPDYTVAVLISISSTTLSGEVGSLDMGNIGRGKPYQRSSVTTLSRPPAPLLTLAERCGVPLPFWR